MPKKVGRGRKYTTGIKRTKSGGYGGQTYSRNGCMVLLIPGFLTLLMGVAVLLHG